MNILKSGLLILILSLSVYHINAQNIDIRLLEHINSPVNGADNNWRLVSNSLTVVVLAAPVSMFVTGLATHNRDLEIKACETGASVVIGEGVTFILKHATGRKRPYIAHPDLFTGKMDETDYSFPSGNTSAAFATATSLSLSFHKWYVVVPAYSYAALVGYSRMYLGVHYPSDVLAGALIGTGSSLLTWKLQKLLLRNRKHTAE